MNFVVCLDFFVILKSCSDSPILYGFYLFNDSQLANLEEEVESKTKEIDQLLKPLTVEEKTKLQKIETLEEEIKEN